MYFSMHNAIFTSNMTLHFRFYKTKAQQNLDRKANWQSIQVSQVIN